MDEEVGAGYVCSCSVEGGAGVDYDAEEGGDRGDPETADVEGRVESYVWEGDSLGCGGLGVVDIDGGVEECAGGGRVSVCFLKM